MIDLLATARILENNSDLRSTFDLTKIVDFLEILSLLKPTLEWYQPSYIHSPLERLPISIHEFLVLSLNIPDDVCKLAWDQFREMAWNFSLTEATALAWRTKHLMKFLEYGVGWNIGLLLSCALWINF